MVFDTDEIPDEGLDFEMRESPEYFEINEADCKICRDVQLRGSLRKVGSDVFLTGRVQTELLVSCSRCLEPVKLPIASEISAHYVPRPGDSEGENQVELHLDDIDKEFYEAKQIKLVQAVRDQIMLTVPVACLCKKDCLGLCSSCGKDINRGLCNCKKEQDVDPRLEVLKSLRDKLK